MIIFNNNTFILQTENTGYMFRITKHCHLEHIYYGNKLPDGISAQDIEALAPKRTAQAGSTVAYDKEDNLYCLDTMCFEWSGIGRGDYRFSPAEIKMPDGSFVSDFIYESHSVKEGIIPMKELPSSHGAENECASLEIILRDKVCSVTLKLIYTVFEKSDCITRRVILENNGASLVIRRLLSMSLDMANFSRIKKITVTMIKSAMFPNWLSELVIPSDAPAFSCFAMSIAMEARYQHYYMFTRTEKNHKEHDKKFGQEKTA